MLREQRCFRSRASPRRRRGRARSPERCGEARPGACIGERRSPWRLRRRPSPEPRAHDSRGPAGPAMSATLRGSCPRRGTSRSDDYEPSRRRSWTPTSTTTTPAVPGTSVRSRGPARVPSVGDQPRVSADRDRRIRRRRSSGRPSPSRSSWRRGRTGSANPEGNGGTVRGAATAGTIAVVSSTPSDDVEGIAAASDAPKCGSCTWSRSEALRGHARPRRVVGCIEPSAGRSNSPSRTRHRTRGAGS